MKKKDDIDRLISRAKDLLDYHEKYGRYIVVDDDDAIIYKEKNPPTKHVETIYNYLTTFVNIEFVLLAVDKGNVEIEPDKKAYLIEAMNKTKNIVEELLSRETLLHNMADLIETVEQEATDVINYDPKYFKHTYDLFRYEFTCGMRDVIEECLFFLKTHASLGEAEAIPLSLMKRLCETDKLLRKALNRITSTFPPVEWEFADCPFYIPKGYWWHSCFDQENNAA